MNPKELAYCTVANQFGEAFAMKAERFFGRVDFLPRLNMLRLMYNAIYGTNPSKVYLTPEDCMELIRKHNCHAPQTKASLCGLEVMSTTATETRVE